MKKAVLIICALCVVMLFAGCGGKKTVDVSNSEQSNSVSRVDSNSQSAEENTLENNVDDNGENSKKNDNNAQKGGSTTANSQSGVSKNETATNSSSENSQKGESSSQTTVLENDTPKDENTDLITDTGNAIGGLW